MDKKLFLSTLFLMVFISGVVSATPICETYDDFSSGTLNTSKWEIRQDVEGQPLMDEYWVDSNLENFHTQQNIIGDRRVYLFPKRQFTTGDTIKYNATLVSKTGNHGQMILLTGNQDIRIGIFGYSDGIQGFDELGTAYIEMTFEENNLAIRRESPLGTILIDNLALINTNGNYELYIGSFSGHNGVVHIDYDNFVICSEESEPTLEERIEELEERVGKIEERTSLLEGLVDKIVEFIKRLPKGLSKHWS